MNHINNNNDDNFLCIIILGDKAQWRDKTKRVSKSRNRRIRASRTDEGGRKLKRIGSIKEGFRRWRNEMYFFLI